MTENNIHKKVRQYMFDNKESTHEDIRKQFPDDSMDAVKKAFQRTQKELKELDNKKISMDMVEKLIMKQVKKNPDVSSLRLMVDFLKIKSQDTSELQELDMDLFYKKAMEN